MAVELWSETFSLFVTLSNATDEELMNIVREFFETGQGNTKAAEMAVKILRERGYKPAITFVKDK